MLPELRMASGSPFQTFGAVQEKQRAAVMWFADSLVNSHDQIAFKLANLNASSLHFANQH